MNQLDLIIRTQFYSLYEYYLVQKELYSLWSLFHLQLNYVRCYTGFRADKIIEL